MQITYTLPADSLDEDFLEKIKGNFAGKKVNIIIEDIAEPAFTDQSRLFTRMETLRKKIEHIKVDPNIDLSSLANDVNL